MCQLTKSKKGNEVREYFIQVESLLNKYKDYIINGMKEKINKLEKDQKPKLNPSEKELFIFFKQQKILYIKYVEQKI